MPSFWDRACLFNDGASEPLDLEVFRTGMLLWVTDVITKTRAMQLFGLTPAQQDDFEFLVGQFGSMPGYGDRPPWVHYVVAIFHGARLGVENLDSVENVANILGVNLNPVVG
jgi:hypothetical protein